MSKRPHQQERTFSMSVQTPEPIYSERRKGYSSSSSSSSLNRRRHSFMRSGTEILLNDGLSGGSLVYNGLSEEQKERIRFSQVGRRKDFVRFETIDGRETNVLEGLELHTRVFSVEEQKKIVEYVYKLQRLGQNGRLRERTYLEPRKWMPGKGRVTIQFGCCYNYAVDKNGNPPGIIRDEEVDPLPPLFKQMIKRMVRWHILPPTCIPNSCIVNIYDEGDCIPPHIDHHDFVRPFCTVSFLNECNIVFGSKLKILRSGEFFGPVTIPLPVGSVLILNGNGADIAKHCVPAVPAKRISITFRKMDDSKLPFKFLPDPELSRIKPIYLAPLDKSRVHQNKHNNHLARHHATRSSYQYNNHLAGSYATRSSYQYNRQRYEEYEDDESYMHEMDDGKLSFKFSPDPALLRIKRKDYAPLDKSRVHQNEHNNHLAYSHAARSSFHYNRRRYDEYEYDESYMQETETFRRMDKESFVVENGDSLPRHGSNFRNRSRDTRRRSWR